ncbi:putative U-box domain-containing protein 42 [Lycium ferocissimum]|uniref:putative U-box domain-containing protein 42 n=1 Tax=Lycium ferocissimum TaxID=112874 RepID=UPI002814BDFD|nr:putative U-box domain-containing protein 42 [Lycium ferocissimum]
MDTSGSTDSDIILINRERDRVGILVESLLEDISQFIKLVVSIDVEKENFIEIGSYLYRASAVIMDLQIGTNATSNVIEKLRSMFEHVHLANELIKKCQNYRQLNQLTEPSASAVVEQLQVVNGHIAEGLSLIPSSVYWEQECAEIAVKSLSKDMKGAAAFVARKNLVSEQTELEVHKFSSRELLTNGTEETETDLYSIDVDVSMENLRLADSTNIHISNNSRSSISIGLHNWSYGSLTNLPRISESEYIEPLYETFFCPLTEKIMEDPVTIESGVTYERDAISEWIKNSDNREEIFCPKSGQKLKSRNLSTNVALKATIDEWKERNEAARIKVAKAALSSASTNDTILKAIEDLQLICLRKPYNKVQVRNIGVIPLLGNLLDNRNRTIRCATLELLRYLAEDDDEEIIAETIDISTVTRMLSSNHGPIRHASLRLLLELSKSQFLCDNIGSVPGAILMLITAKYRHTDDAFVADKADEVLQSLEKYPCNIKHMAENGYLEPLLNHLLEGSEEMKMAMARYLGEIVLGPDSIIYVAERASPTLIKMVECGNSVRRNAAFRALQQISSYHPNASTLVEAGLVQIMIEEIFNQTVHDEPVNSKKEAAGILANVLESGLVELENLQVNGHGHTLASDYMIFNFVQRIKNSTPEEMNFHLVRILICLMKYPNASSTIISVIKETDASYNLIELINSPDEELSIAALKLLITLSPFMGHTISDRLCKTKGQPESLIHDPSESPTITEKQAVSATLLAKLPHQNMTLNLALVNKNTIPTIIEQINKIHVSGTRTSRYTNVYFDGLIGTLVRLTTTLYDHQILHVVRVFNFTYIFTELLVKTSSDEVQKLSAIGLANLSKQSVNLSKPPPIKNNNKYLKSFLLRRCMSLHSKSEKVPLCSVHRGICSAEESFCLIDAKAIERLLSCLHHDNVEVVEASLSAISTLLDDKVDVDKSVELLIEMQTIQHVLNVVKEHRENNVLWHKSFWLIEKFLSKGGDKSVSDISQDRLFPASVVSAFHHGDVCTRQMAEKILMHLNKMPHFANTASFTT